MNIYGTVIEKSKRGVDRSEKNARRLSRRQSGKSASKPVCKGSGNGIVAGIGGALGLAPKTTSHERTAMAQESKKADALALVLAAASAIATIGGIIAFYLFR